MRCISPVTAESQTVNSSNTRSAPAVLCVPTYTGRLAGALRALQRRSFHESFQNDTDILNIHRLMRCDTSITTETDSRTQRVASRVLCVACATSSTGESSPTRRTTSVELNVEILCFPTVSYTLHRAQNSNTSQQATPALPQRNNNSPDKLTGA